MSRMVCPWCGLAVQPGRTPAGDLLCPACGNTGIARPDAPRGDAPASSSAGVVLAVVLVAVLGLVAVAVFLLPKAMPGDGPYATAPAISFARDEQGPGGTATVVQAPEGLQWDDLAVQGDADCVAPVGRVAPGDVIACRQAGMLEVIHLPTNTLLYSVAFE